MCAAAIALGLGGCTTVSEAVKSASETTGEFWDATVDFVSQPFEGEYDQTAGENVGPRDDVEDWEAIQSSADPEDFRRFIRKYPNSALAFLARRKLNELADDANNQTATTLSTRAPFPPTVDGANPPPLEPRGVFPTPWVIGRWAFDCTVKENSGGVTYIRLDDRHVRIQRDNGAANDYRIKRMDNILELESGGLLYRDLIVSDRELRSFAVRQNGTWHKVNLTYQKCS